MKFLYAKLRNNSIYSRCLLCFYFVLLCTISAHSQNTSIANVNVTGVVRGQEGTPIVGVTVIIPGTTKGTVTDVKGRFSLLASNNDTLQFRFIGYESQDVRVGNRKNFDITLSEDSQRLDDVVVVGYGTVKKSDITGSVASIKGDKLTEKSVFSAIQGLQGNAAGVTISQTSTRPGVEAKIRIRGNRSLKASNQPLFVVDGVPTTMDISEIAPSDIESVEILKDASATAIYGSRGANGVVLITTKKGKSGEASIDVNSYYGIQTAANPLEPMNGPQWVEMVREANRATSKGTPYPLIPTLESDRSISYFTADQVVWDRLSKSYNEDGSWNPNKLLYDDWMGNTLRTAGIQNHSVSVSGGTDKLKVIASATYFKQDGVVKGQSYDRISTRFNFDWDISKYLKLGGSNGFSTNQGITSGNISSSVVSVYPVAEIYDDAGALTTCKPGGDALKWNYILDVDHRKDETRKARFAGSYYLELSLPLGIKFRSNLGIDIGNRRQGTFNGALSSNRQGGLATATNSSSYSSMYNWENIIYFNKTFKKHDVGFTFVQSVQEATSESLGVDVNDLPYESQLWYNLGSSPTIKSVDSDYSRWALSSFMARLNYGFDDKYLLTLSVRYDGSSRLAEGNKWEAFPSGALAWKLKNESFLRDWKPLTSLKLRLGWGVTGNTAISAYETQGRLNVDRYVYGSQGVLGFGQSTLSNPKLGWEKTSQINLGIDFGFIDNRITGSVDLYRQKTSDLLMPRMLPGVSGFGNVLSNIGKTQNKGIEITLNTRNINTTNFSWSSDLTFARNKEEILELSSGIAQDLGNKWFVGHPASVFYDYDKIGIWQLEDAEEMNKFNAKGASYMAGQIRVRDLNRDYKITAEDRTIIGQVEPDFTIGFTNYFKYKNLDLSVIGYGAFGQTINYDRYLLLNGRLNSINVNYWKIIGYDENNKPISNKSNEVPRPNKDFDPPIYSSSMNYFDASFFRISQATLGYTFSTTWINKVSISKLRVYVSVQNPCVFTSFPGTDPEGGTNFSEPMPRTWLFGANLSF